MNYVNLTPHAICLNDGRIYEPSGIVAPASGHPEVVRNEKGHIVSVPCFV